MESRLLTLIVEKVFCPPFAVWSATVLNTSALSSFGALMRSIMLQFTKHAIETNLISVYQTGTLAWLHLLRLDYCLHSCCGVYG